MTRGPRTAQIGRWALRCGAALMALGAIGCGPTSAHLAIADARIAVEAARGARAETFSVFEFTCAVEHLRKASEEEGYADFDAAVRLAKAAQTFAEAARTRALGRTNAAGAPTSLAPAPIQPASVQPVRVTPTATPTPTPVTPPPAQGTP